LITTFSLINLGLFGIFKPRPKVSFIFLHGFSVLQSARLFFLRDLWLATINLCLVPPP
jgi:hypothetical protein